MEIDYTDLMLISMFIIIAVLILYEYSKPKEMRGIEPTVLFNRFRESMDVLSEAEKRKCFRCGGKLQVLRASLYEDNRLTLACKPCGVTEVWQRKEGKGFKKTQWIVTVHETTEEELKVIEELQKATEKLKEKGKTREAPAIPEPPTLRGPDVGR